MALLKGVYHMTFKEHGQQCHGGTPSLGPLTAREREVAALLAQGLTKEEVGRRLFISPNTVNRHAVNLMAKLRVRNRAELTLEAIRLKLISP